MPEEWHALKDHIFNLVRQKQETVREEKVRQQTLAHRRKYFDDNWDLVTKFLEIAERKVSMLDEYGEESWDALPQEIVTVTLKIAKRMKLPVGEKEVRECLADEQDGKWISERLTAAFHEYHDKMKARPARTLAVDGLIRLVDGSMLKNGVISGCSRLWANHSATFSLGGAYCLGVVVARQV